MAKQPSNKVRISPMADKVLLQEVKEHHQTTQSGIILPDSSDKDTKKGIVVAVGPGHYEGDKLVPVAVTPGQTVIYSWGDKVKIDNEEYVIVREGDITAIIH